MSRPQYPSPCLEVNEQLLTSALLFCAFRWTGTLLEVVNSALCSTQPPTYSTIVSLDKQLRASPLPDKLSTASDPCRKVELSQYTQPSIRWQEHMVYLLNNYSLLLLHRPFFARALLESPNDVFQHRFLRSVMTVHDSSKAIVRQVRWLTQNEPETLQMLPFWQLAVVCSLVCQFSILRYRLFGSV